MNPAAFIRCLGKFNFELNETFLDCSRNLAGRMPAFRQMKNQISEFLQSRIEAKDFPSAVYTVAERGEIVLHDALGLAVVEPGKIEAQTNTIYDLASLTKPLVTGLLCAKLIENDEINLSDKISKYFSKFDTNEKREITLGNLLVHTSGFPAWRPFYLISETKFQILNSIASETLEKGVNSRVVYSDLNFITLGFLLEKIYEKTLDRVTNQEIVAPLELRDTFFNPPKTKQKRIAASENGNIFEKQTAEEAGFTAAKTKIRNLKSKIERFGAKFTMEIVIL
jgi:serine-type D-Ala-D-Ala carboxypeptidase